MSVTKYESTNTQTTSSSSQYLIPLRTPRLSEPGSAMAISLHVAKIFNLSFDQIRTFLPKGQIKSLERRIKHSGEHVKTLTGFGSIISIQLEYSRRYDTPKKYHELLQLEQRNDMKLIREENELKDLMFDQIKLMSLLLMSNLVCSNSDNYEQLVSKSEILDSKKAAAERIYLTAPENIERRRMIDLKILNDGESDEEARSVVTEYWDTFPLGEQRIIHHQIGETLLKNLFSMLKNSISETVDYLVKSRENRPKGVQFNLPGKVDHQIQTIVDGYLEQFFTDFETLTTCPDSITLRYFRFKSRKLAYSQAHKKIRHLLETEYKYKNLTYECCVKGEKAKLMIILESKKDFLRVLEECFDKQNEDKESSPTIKEDNLQYLQKIKGEITKYELDLATKTDDDFFLIGDKELPHTYPSVLEKHKEAPSEWEILELYKHKCKSSLLAFDTLKLMAETCSTKTIEIDGEPDLVRIEDPTQPLLDKIRCEDEERLALDRTKIKKKNQCAIV